MISVRLIMWALLAGAGIPIMGIINGRLGRSLGVTLHAPVVAITIALILSLVITWTVTKSLPSFQEFAVVKPIEYLGGFIVAFYVISATLLAPRIGVVNFIACAVSAQIIISVLIDHFGLFGAMVRPISLSRFLGIGLLLSGLIITQFADAKLK
jgi:transporter family-2 protein